MRARTVLGIGVLVCAAAVAALAADAAGADRAVAYGLLFDSPPPAKVIDTGIVIADKLRRRYGIDTGDLLADRRAAARRAREEWLDRLTFTEPQIRAAARALGYSLDPQRCRNTCTHVRALASIELQKRALAAFADGVALPDPRRSGRFLPWSKSAAANFDKGQNRQ